MTQDSGRPPARAATDLFPELSDEIDRRDPHSEQRIKFWVMAGIVANLLVAVVPRFLWCLPWVRSAAISVRRHRLNRRKRLNSPPSASGCRIDIIWEVRVDAALHPGHPD